MKNKLVELSTVFMILILFTLLFFLYNFVFCKRTIETINWTSYLKYALIVIVSTAVGKLIKIYSKRQKIRTNSAITFEKQNS